jgi:hypothetical protein
MSYAAQHALLPNRNMTRTPCMWMEIRNRNSLSPKLLRYIERRLRFVLGRFGNRVQRVTVCLTDPKGTNGEVSKQCTIAVKLTPRGTVYVEDMDTDGQTVVDRIAGLVSRLVDRELQRRRAETAVNPAETWNELP